MKIKSSALFLLHDSFAIVVNWFNLNSLIFILEFNYLTTDKHFHY